MRRHIDDIFEDFRRDMESMVSIKEVFMGAKKHTSFEDYQEDVSKLSKMAEQVEFTIIREAIKHGRLELQKRIDV